MIYRKNREQDANAHLHHHALSTASGTLRNHLDKSHRAEYDRLCAQNGWKNYLAEADIQKAAKAKEVIQVAKRESFTMDGLLNRLVRFIVADDQVSNYVSLRNFLLTFNHQSIRVVECIEFRELLLFACQEISDSDLPKRDKIHNMIVDASVDYFEVLKKQMGVCYLFSLKSCSSFTAFI